jgi:hypothetical protein
MDQHEIGKHGSELIILIENLTRLGIHMIMFTSITLYHYFKIKDGGGSIDQKLVSPE